MADTKFQNLEEEITKKKVVYFQNIKYNSEEKRLILTVLRNVEERPLVISRVLTFYGVENFFEELHEDFDEKLLESLLGLAQQPQENGTLYQIVTDQRAISFYTGVEPQIEELS